MPAGERKKIPDFVQQGRGFAEQLKRLFFRRQGRGGLWITERDEETVQGVQKNPFILGDRKSVRGTETRQFGQVVNLLRQLARLVNVKCFKRVFHKLMGCLCYRFPCSFTGESL